MYGGDGAAARRLAEQMLFSDSPRRDSVLAYLAMFDGDLPAAAESAAKLAADSCPEFAITVE